MDGLTCYISQYVDYILQPIVRSLPAYVCDSSYILEQLEQYKWFPEYTWLSLDMSSLYTCCAQSPYTTGIEALKHFLLSTDQFNPLEAKFISDCTEFALEHN